MILIVFTHSFNLYCNDSLHLDREEFKYANSYRYTLLGELPPKDTKLNTTRTIAVGTTIGALFTIQHIAQAQSIWNNPDSENNILKFNVVEDGAYGLYVDKAGHFVSGYDASYLFGEAFFLTGMDVRDATLWGGVFGWIYLNYIEVMDGFAVNFGFSPSDVYLNTAGSLFYILQYYIPYLQNITPKFTYFSADLHGQYPREERIYWVDDYSSQTFWLSFNIHNMLPKNLQKYWPAWIDLSLGYAARSMCGACEKYDYSQVAVSNYDWGKWSPTLGSPKYIVSLDWNLTQIFPDKGPGWLNWTKQTLNLFKWPSPAVEFSRDAPPRYFITYPFPLW